MLTLHLVVGLIDCISAKLAVQDILRRAWGTSSLGFWLNHFAPP